MKDICITAHNNEQALAIAEKRFKIPGKYIKIVSSEKFDSDMLDGAEPLECRITIRIDENYLLDTAREKTLQLLEFVGVVGEIRSNLDGNVINLKIQANNPAVLIGPKGENLDAFQHIINRMINRGERDLPIVVLDIQNYRQRRLQEIESIAKKAAFSVLKYKKEFVLPTMNSEERKLIHNKIKEFPNLVSYSRGRENDRQVVVDLLANQDKQK